MVTMTTEKFRKMIMSFSENANFQVVIKLSFVKAKFLKHGEKIAAFLLISELLFLIGRYVPLFGEG